MVTKRVDHFGPDSSGSKESCIRRGQDRKNLLASWRNEWQVVIKLVSCYGY